MAYTHGTHIAGVIAGTGAASRGKYAGVAPGAELTILKATAGKGHEDDIGAAVNEAVDRGVDIITFSGARRITDPWPPPWKGPMSPGFLDRIFSYARTKNVLAVVSAGNYGPNTGSVVPPGLNQDVLCVGAIGRDGAVSPNSSRGPHYFDPAARKGSLTRADPAFGDNPSTLLKPDLVASGGGTMSYNEASNRHGNPFFDGPVAPRSSHCAEPPAANDFYTSISGTSQAAAVVSGIAALAIELGRRMGFPWGSNPAQTPSSTIPNFVHDTG